MESKLSQQLVGSFEVPDNIAKRLSELLVTQTIRERMLSQNIGDPIKYEQVEQMLIPIVTEIESIKAKITREYVPEEFRTDKFIWNYDGYDIDGTTVYIFTA